MTTPDWMPPLPHHGFLNDEIMVYTRQQIVDYALAAVEAYKRSLKPFGRYGCHCDLDEGQKPDDCVLNLNRPQDCVYAGKLLRQGKDQSSCEYWKPIRLDGGDDA